MTATIRASAPLARLHGLVAGVAGRPPIALALIVAAGTAFAAYYSTQVENWFVMTDELLYQRLALDIGHVLLELPASGEYSWGVKSVLYPLLVAGPFKALATPQAYEVVHVLNALIMASTAIPTYLLARSVAVPRGYAYAAAALAVSVPWMTQSMIVWTEVAAYPAFTWAVLGMQHALARPSARADVLALGGIAVAYLARTQFLVLALVFPVAILLHELRFASGKTARARAAAWARAVLVGHRGAAIGYGLVALGALALAVFASVEEPAGSYAATLDGDLLPPGLFHTFGLLLGIVAVGSGLLPFAAGLGWVLTNLARPSSRAAHAAGLVMLLSVLAIGLAASSFLIRFSPDSVQDRYLFYVVPLAFVGLAALLASPRRHLVGLAAGAATAAWVVSLGSYEEGTGASFFTSPVSVFYKVLDGRAGQAGEWLGITDLAPSDALVAATLAVAAAVAAAAWWRPRLAVAVLPILLAYCVAETAYVSARGIGATGDGNLATGNVPLADRDWIDEAVPDGESATLVPAYTQADPYLVERLWWDTAFWNKTTEHMYSYDGSRTYGNIHSSPMTLDWPSGRLGASGGSRYWVTATTDRRFGPAVTRELAGGFGVLRLVEVDEPYRASWAVRGALLEDGWVLAGEPARIRVYGDPDGEPRAKEVRMTLSTPADVTGPRRYGVRFGHDRTAGTLGLLTTRVVRARACVPAGGHRDAVLVVPTGNRLPPPDNRLIGLSMAELGVRDAGPCRAPANR
jgi:hypothetical protein